MRLLAFSILLFTNYSFCQVWETRVITPKESIEKNRCVEIGINPSDLLLKEINKYLNSQPHQRKGLNPFVSWDVNITAEFTHKETDRKAGGIAFWYTNVERDHLNGYWNQLETPLPFRIRFAPPLSGEWNVKIFRETSSQKKVLIDELKIVVKEKNNPGNVTIHESNRYLERDAEIVLPTGVNLPFPYVNNNLLYSQDRDEKLKLRAWVEYRKLVQQYLVQGGKYFRFFIHPSTTDIEFEEVGYYQSRQHYAWEVDQIVKMCEENNALINFNFLYHTMMMKMGDYYQFKYDYTDNWHDKTAWPYKDINYISGYSKLLSSKTPSDMILNEKAFRYLKEKTRYMMARWGYSTALSNIELVSEPWHIDQNGFTHQTPYDSLNVAGDIARKAAYKYHSELASYIKDSLLIKNKLIAAVGRFPAGGSRIHSHLTSSTPQQIDSTWYDENIDFISISYYSSSPTKAIISKNSSNNDCGSEENSMACVIQRLHDTYDKPIIFGEADHGDGTPICSDLQGHRIDIKRYLFTGAAGHYIWAAFNYPDHTNKQPQDERLSWRGIINAQEYYNSSEIQKIFSNQFIQGRQKVPFKGSREALAEQQYLIDSSRTSAAGYIYNRSFNVHTAGGKEVPKESTCYINTKDYQTSVSITWKPQKLKVVGLKPLKRYTIRYYGFCQGEFLSQNQIHSSIFGKLKLKHPVLTASKKGNPLIWYTIQEH